MRIIDLQCDYMHNPVGFDFDRPVLNWMLEDARRNAYQSAFEVQVSSDAAFETVLFDSGKVLSDDSVGFRLGMRLRPRTRYYWRVNVWDEVGNESGYCDCAYFETARYDEAWHADWIGFDEDFPQLRKGFSVDKPVRRARAYTSGVGLYRMFLNGADVADELLTPNFNAYDLWIQYQTYDVTDKIRQGWNVAGAWLGNGYYRGRVNLPDFPIRRNIYGDTLGYILELVIEYTDGSVETILTDDTWEAMRNPYTRTEIFDGEVFDARMLDDAWCLKTGSGAQARTAAIDKARLRARKSVPVKVMHTLPVARKIITPLGEQVLDFGQNIAGRLRIVIDAPRDTEILFQFGETLDEHGNFYRENMRTAKEEFKYISDGQPRTYAENFTFHGFQYVRVRGWDIDPKDVVAESAYSALDRTGWFSCSDARVNKLFMNALWSQRDNFVDTPTDCPQRDERMGWTGDAQVFCPTACMNMACDAFYRKYLYDLKLEQAKVGYVPVVVPFVILGSGIWECPTTGWADAAVLIPWNLYLYYGDTAILETQYESMRNWVEWMRARDTQGRNLFEGHHIGDWLAMDSRDPEDPHGATPETLIATAYYAVSTRIVAQTAGILGKTDDEALYRRLADKIGEAFRAEFVSPAGRVVSDTQTAYALALYMDLLLPEQRKTAAKCLAERIQKDQYRLTTGFLGTPYLCPALSEAELDEYAYALLLQNTCPSWLFEVEMGANTIWERWNSVHEDHTLGPVSMNSLNHYAFGAVCEWLYRYAAGINTVADKPGYKAIRIHPRIHEKLAHVDAHIITPYGKVGSAWKLNGDRVEVAVEIPCNTTATICLPDAGSARITCNGQTVQAERYEDGCAVFTRGSGKWAFGYTPTGERVKKRVPEPEAPWYLNEGVEMIPFTQREEYKQEM